MNTEAIAKLGTASYQAGRPRPWIRYWARSLDLALAGATFALVVNSLGLEVAHWNNFAFGWLALMLWVPFEAAFVSACGTTPGKWLFNIRLSKPDQSFLTLPEALRRSIAVLIMGLGCGLPIIAFFTQIAAWGALNKRGATPWDEQCGVVVKHEPIDAGRILGIILIFLVLLFLLGMGSAMKDSTATASAV
jgi:uncharacterized RDD family membrane protein YckC